MVRPNVRLCLLASAVACLVGCHPDYEVELPGGYSLLRASADNIVVMRPGQVVVWPKVAEIQVVGDLVIGRVERSSFSKSGGEEDSVGFFVVDTKSDSVATRLSELEFRESLSQRGVHWDAVRMVPPYRLTGRRL